MGYFLYEYQCVLTLPCAQFQGTSVLCSFFNISDCSLCDNAVPIIMLRYNDDELF